MTKLQKIELIKQEGICEAMDQFITTDQLHNDLEKIKNDFLSGKQHSELDCDNLMSVSGAIEAALIVMINNDMI